MTRRYNPAYATEEQPTMEILDGIAEGGNQTLTWRGHKCWKNPLDLMIYQEIVHEVRPTLVIETGTHAGGSALFWLDMMIACGCIGPEVVSIDVAAREPLPQHDRLVFIEGSSTDSEVIGEVARIAVASGHGPILVNLDSDHASKHVSAELDLYAPFVTAGSYLIVEDGIDDFRWGREGPHAATVAWLPNHPEFAADQYRERLGITNCPTGFLRRS